MKASYFSAQSLGWLGAAINPLVSGVVLTSLPPSSLFVILALVIIAAWVLMLKDSCKTVGAARALLI